MTKLPEGWLNISLREAGKYINGRAFKPKEWEQEGLPIIRIQNLNNPKAPYNFSSKTHEEVFKVYPGDLLVAWSASLGVYIWSNGQAWLNQHIFKVLPNNKIITRKYLYYALKDAIADLYKKAHGTGMVHVTKPVFEAHPLPLPPLAEQHRIASRLDQLMPRIESVRRRLDSIPSLLKRFRQSVLTAAVTGKLTEKWREEHPEVESAERILAELKKTRIANAKTNADIAKLNDIYSQTETNSSTSLPINWLYASLNKTCDSFQYGTSSKSNKTGKVPVIRMGNLQSGVIDWNDLVYTSDENEIKKYSLKAGDVLFNRTNSPELVGKTSIYLGERQAIFAGYLIRINNFSILDSKYLNYVLNTHYAKEYCNKVKTDGVSQSNINAQKLGKFEVPLPPLAEQQEIVRQVDRLFALADKLEAHYTRAKAKVDALPQSVLAKAFAGELVPTEAELARREGRTYETAAQLLERIQTESAALDADT